VRPAVALEMEDDLPRTVTAGIYPVERGGELSFAWTHPLATITLKGLDRSVAWTCTVVARGSRPGGIPQPDAAFGVDGVTAVTTTLGNEFTSVDVAVPARTSRGVTLSVSARPVYVPGPGDPRQLGVQLDRVACTPSGGVVLPPAEAVLTVVLAGALFGLLFAALSSTTSVLLVACALFGLAGAFAMTTGPAVHVTAYLAWWLPVSLWIVGPLLLFILWRGRSVSPAGLFVLGATAAILFVQLIALLHPSKDVVDAVFHARRLGWVLDGRYYFTQPMPGGVQFPYAIGLYVSAAPFAGLVRDHVALLRIVVCTAEALAGICVYLLVARVARDRSAAAAAAVLYHLAPLPYVVIGNANLTFAFGQSIAVIAACLALFLEGSRARMAGLAAIFGVTALAFLSHVAVFPLLGVTLVSLGGLLWLTRDPAMKRKGIEIAAVAVVAALLSVAIYYAHFPEVWGTLDRVSSTQPDAGPTDDIPQALSYGDRAARALYLGQRSFGLPLVALALFGAFAVGRSPRDQLRLGLLAWVIAMVIFLAFRTLAPVDPRLQRYADEFIERVYYLTLPAIAILAGRAFSYAWTAGTMIRGVAAALMACAAWVGVERWYSWIR
jgi:hypothetical protein